MLEEALTQVIGGKARGTEKEHTFLQTEGNMLEVLGMMLNMARAHFITKMEASIRARGRMMRRVDKALSWDQEDTHIQVSG